MKTGKFLTLKVERSLKTYFHEAQRLKTFEDLEEHFLGNIDIIIRGDNPCWNNWTTDLSSIQSLRANPKYVSSSLKLVESLNHTISQHPILLAGGWHLLEDGCGRISDHISDQKWQSTNALYRETYRHLDVKRQLAVHVTTLSDRALVLTLNRPSHDFTLEEMDHLNVFSDGLEFISSNLERQTKLKARVDRLNCTLHTLCGSQKKAKLTPREISALGSIHISKSIGEAAARENVAASTFAERLGSVREKLGLHSLPQLRAILREFARGELRDSSGRQKVREP